MCVPILSSWKASSVSPAVTGEVVMPFLGRSVWTAWGELEKWLILPTSSTHKDILHLWIPVTHTTWLQWSWGNIKPHVENCWGQKSAWTFQSSLERNCPSLLWDGMARSIDRLLGITVRKRQLRNIAKQQSLCSLAAFFKIQCYFMLVFWFCLFFGILFDFILSLYLIVSNIFPLVDGINFLCLACLAECLWEISLYLLYQCSFR